MSKFYWWQIECTITDNCSPSFSFSESPFAWFSCCFEGFNVLEIKLLNFQLQKFREELKNRSRVLKKLGHIDTDGVVQLKGRAACLVDTGDELLVTELMFNGELIFVSAFWFLYNLQYYVCNSFFFFVPD